MEAAPFVDGARLAAQANQPGAASFASGRCVAERQGVVWGPSLRDATQRSGLKERRIEDHLAQPGTPHGSGLGKVRYVVEGGLAWVGQARRLKIR
jgi:hypothetical protein